MAIKQGAGTVIISAQIEEEISQLEDDEAELFLGEMGLSEAGLDRLIRAGYNLLQLETYFYLWPKRGKSMDSQKRNSRTDKLLELSTGILNVAL